MGSFFDLLTRQLARHSIDQLKNFVDIQRGVLEDKGFEKVYRTLVVGFLREQKGLDRAQAGKLFASPVTYDGVLAWLYNLTNPDHELRDTCRTALCRHADYYKITAGQKRTNAWFVERFLKNLESELKKSANKSLLPLFAEVRADIQKEGEKTRDKIDAATEKVSGEIQDFRDTVEQYFTEQRDREQRPTQIDDAGEHITVAGKRVYDATAEPAPPVELPLIRCSLEAVDASEHKYRAVLSDGHGKTLHKHNFTLKPDDVFLLEANHFLENDGLRDFRQQLSLASDRTFTQRLGSHFYRLIIGGDGPLRDYLKANGALNNGFKFVLDLDTEAGLLWRVPWEFLRDSREFLGLSGKVHLLRRPLGAGELSLTAVPRPLRILVVVSNPADQGEFDSERALSNIQEAVDFARRQGWVELDYLEEATFARVQQRLSAFKPQAVHYIGHGGKNPSQKEAIKPPFSGEPGETFLAFQNDDGELAPLYGRELQRLLASPGGVQLLVLSGCMTGQTADSDALSGVGTALLHDNLPALVVMQYSVLVDTAIQFAKVFYEQIGRGESLSRALTHVRQVLAQGRGEHRADWGIPALYLRASHLQLVDPTAPPRPQPERATTTAIGDLPVVANFVGRTRELRRLRETVRNPRKPVIYLWGLGGIGKTSVTAKLIEKLDDEGALDGRLVIRCDYIEPTFAAVAEKLGNFISLQGKGGHAEAGLALQDSRYDLDTRVSLLNRAIKDRRYLIVFDNFESLFSEAAPQVGTLADAELNTFFRALFSHNWSGTFLFTCRYRWDMLIEEPGMQRFTCHLPLANCLLLHLPGLSPAQTRMLMRNLEALSQLTFSEQSRVLPLLLGHPHTIKLFDGYLKEHGLEAVLRDENIAGLGDRPVAQTAPAKIIEQLGDYFLDGLWARLSAPERQVLGLLSVFRSGLSEADLAKLVADPQALHTLRNYSLLQNAPREMAASPISRGEPGEASEAGSSLGQVHPVVRGYVESKVETGKLREYHLRAVDFLVQQQAARLPKIEGIDKWTPALLAKLAEMFAQRGQRQVAEHLTASLLQMHHHLFVAGEYEQADDLVNALWQFLAMLGRRELAKALLRQSIASLQGFSKYVALGNLATLLNDEGKWQQALKTYQQCIEYFEKSGNKQNAAVGMSQQAQIYQERGDYARALELEREALQIKEEIKDESAVIQHYRIAQLLFLMKKYDQALTAGEQALDKARAIENHQLEAACLHQLGLTLNKLDRPQEAFEKFQQSLAIEEELGNRAGQADSLGEMGKLLMNAGHHAEALQFLQRGMAINIELQDYVKAAIKLEKIGIVFERQGHFAEALEKYGEALRLKKQFHNQQGIAITENNIARVRGKMGGQ